MGLLMASTATGPAMQGNPFTAALSNLARAARTKAFWFTNDGGEFALDCLTGAAIHAKAMPSSSHGMAATRWSPQAAVVGQKNSPMARLKVRYPSKAVTTFPSSARRLATSSTAC